MSIVDIDPVTGRQIVLVDAFGYNGQYNVKATGFFGTATKNTTTQILFAIGAADRYIQGVHLLLRNHVWGDTISLFEIVDHDNVLGFGADLVLNQFVFTWNVNDQMQDQEKEAFSYVGRIPAGCYIRLTYVSVGTVNDVDVRLNCILHAKVA